MFSGLGSLSDLNNTFTQFTSNLTNLDSLQDGNTQQPNLTPQIVISNSTDGQHSSDSIHRLEQKNVELSELLQVEQALVNDLKAYLTVKDELLQNKEAEVTGLTERIHVAERQLQEVTHSFEVFKVESEERINAATPTLVVSEPISPTKKSIAEKKVAKLTSTVENLTSELKFANDKISELENMLAASPQMVSAPHVSESLKDHKVENDLRTLVNEGSEALHAAEKQIKHLEQHLAKATNDLATKNVTEAELRSLVLLHASEMSDANTRIDDLETQLSAAQDASAQTIDALTMEVSTKQADVERLEGETQSYLNSIVELNEKNTDLVRKSAAAEEERAALAIKLQTLMQSSHQQSESADSVNNEFAQLTEVCETKTRLLQESEVKVSTLTEKLKDMMHRFAELKSKSSLNAQQLEERIADITKLAQAKDSEILGFRLKMENSERSGGDMKLKVAELAERFGESQREIARLREAAEERSAELSALTDQLGATSEALRTCETERVALVGKLKEAEEAAPVQLASYESRIGQLEGQLRRQDAEFAERTAQLRAEIDAAHSRLQVEEDSAGNLDNYKKRAQLALKKANASNACLSAEIQQLQAALEESTARLAESHEANKTLSEQLAAVNSRLEVLRLEKTTMDEAYAALETKTTEKDQEYMCKLEKLNNLLVERTQLAESLQMGHPSQSQDAQQRAAASRAESAPSLVLPGNTTASAAVAAIDEATSSFSSADSDLAGNTHDHAHPHDSHSHHHSAAAAPSDRSSSWAIVTSNGSRASSTLPSTASMDELSRGTAHSPTHHATPYAAQNAPHHNPSAVASDGADDRSDFRAALSSDSLLFISQLQSQLEAVRKDLARRGIDLEAAHQQLQYEKDEKRVLKNRVEELLAFLERTKQLHEGPDSAINMEYLKNCVLKFMSSSDLSEKRRLYPVIATILKLTSQEMKAIEVAFQETEDRENEFQNTLSSIGSFASSSIGSFWGSSS